MNSVSPIVSEDAARRRRCKRINAADLWRRGEYSQLSGFKSDRLSPVGDRGTRYGRCRSFREAMKNHGLPLFVSCRQPRLAAT